MNDEIRAKALALSMREDFVYVTTVDPSGFPETRVMFNFLKMRAEALSSGPAKVPADFASYLGTNTSSRKVAQMRNDNRICLYYSDNSSYEGCMVRGRVREVSNPDTKKAVWMPEWDMYYPGGLEGGDFSLFLFTPELIRYYHGLGVHEFTP